MIDNDTEGAVEKVLNPNGTTGGDMRATTSNSNSKLTEEDYAKHLKDKRLFEDPHFPADNSSLFRYADKPSEGVVEWHASRLSNLSSLYCCEFRSCRPEIRAVEAAIGDMGRRGRAILGGHLRRRHRAGPFGAPHTRIQKRGGIVSSVACLATGRLLVLGRGQRRGLAQR